MIGYVFIFILLALRSMSDVSIAFIQYTTYLNLPIDFLFTILLSFLQMYFVFYSFYELSLMKNFIAIRLDKSHYILFLFKQLLKPFLFYLIINLVIDYVFLGTFFLKLSLVNCGLLALSLCVNLLVKSGIKEQYILCSIVFIILRYTYQFF